MSIQGHGGGNTGGIGGPQGSGTFDNYIDEAFQNISKDLKKEKEKLLEEITSSMQESKPINDQQTV